MSNAVTTVYVDIVRPGRALVTISGADAGGNIIRDGKQLYAENDAGTVIGQARSYEKAALLLADHYGIGERRIEIQKDPDSSLIITSSASRGR